MAISADMLRGHTETIILAQLIKNDSYGYEISKAIEDLSHGELVLKDATLYTAFRRMEHDGFIEVTGAKATPAQHADITASPKKAAPFTTSTKPTGLTP